MKYFVEVKLNKDFIKKDGDKIIVGIKSKPEAGMANIELIKKLSRYLKISRDSIKIIIGKRSRKR